MPARAMWKAELALGDVTVPVKLYSAVEDRKVHFRLLHAADHAPVRQQMVDPETERPILPAETKTAIEVEPGTYVVLTEEDQDSLAPKASRTIEIEQVVPADAIDERWYDRPYYLGPDGDAPGYFALAEVLADKEVVGIARWVMRNKRYVGALQSSGGYLLLDTLRYAEQIVEVGVLRPPAARAPDEQQLALADQLVGALAGRFDPAEYRDEHEEQVRALVAAKAAGRVIQFPKATRRARPRSLMASLQASLTVNRKKAHGRRRA